MISGLPVPISILFLLNRRYKAQLRTQQLRRRTAEPGATPLNPSI